MSYAYAGRHYKRGTDILYALLLKGEGWVMNFKDIGNNQYLVEVAVPIQTGLVQNDKTVEMHDSYCSIKVLLEPEDE